MKVIVESDCRAITFFRVFTFRKRIFTFHERFFTFELYLNGRCGKKRRQNKKEDNNV